MDITRPLPKSVKVQDPKGNVFEQQVKYDWELEFCTKCHEIGHSCKPVSIQKGNPQPDKSKNQKMKQAWRKNESTMAKGAPIKPVKIVEPMNL